MAAGSACEELEQLKRGVSRDYAEEKEKALICLSPCLSKCAYETPFSTFFCPSLPPSGAEGRAAGDTGTELKKWLGGHGKRPETLGTLRLGQLPVGLLHCWRWSPGGEAPQLEHLL